MDYEVFTNIASKNAWFTPFESNSYYRTKYAREGITIHWWGGGEDASKHDSIVNYFSGQAQQGIKSVNFVVSDNKITKMVEPENVAWCSGPGNPTTISIEFQPTLSADGYKRGGWLIDQLEKKFGHLMTLYPHNHWQQTTCPGSIDISRLREEANKFKNGEQGMIKPTEKEVYDAFQKYAQKAPDSPDQVRYYMEHDKYVLLQDLLDFEVVPKQPEVEKAFADLQPWSPINTPPYTDQTKFYTSKPAKFLYEDLAYGLKKRVLELMANDQAKAERLKSLELQQQQDQQAGDSLLRRIGQFIQKYLP